jgi:rubrerythrin
MPHVLSGIEIIDIAKKIETGGVAFYDEARERAKDPEARELFGFLRDEEKRHERQFERLLAKMPEVSADWRDQEEYLGYMSFLAQDLVFPDPGAARAVAADLEDEEAILVKAMEFEKASILYFHEMAPVVLEEDRDLVHHLIDEERKHLQLLRDLLVQLKARG